MYYQAACQVQTFQYGTMIFAMFMDNLVMSLRPQVKTVIKHHVNRNLVIFLQTPKPLRNKRLDTKAQPHTHSNTV